MRITRSSSRTPSSSSSSSSAPVSTTTTRAHRTRTPRATPRIIFPPTPTPIPSLGHAFTTAVRSARAHHATHPDLSSAARDWLTIAVTRLITDLQYSLRRVQANVQNPAALPAWALDPSSTLSLLTPPVPFALRGYTGDFISYLDGVMLQMGFEVRFKVVWEGLGLCTSVGFFGRGSGGPLEVGGCGRVFEEGVVEEVVSGVSGLVLE